MLFERVAGNAVVNGKGAVAMETAVSPDDLTLINGIGPTFARRLQEAGVTTYAKLAILTPEYLKEVTKAADWQADPANWIVQAQARA
ncbi:MAG: hypothetical protein H6662_18290 [Ardenticatenaceae bacterium]|nr:hypothetical protein [Anaerolineales bacterium]MCB8923541.1 hypothetical protein [Ardenticatenaceae bacterium]MCB8991888.1 hypothetical protein [Ardenticatenaceae bacterium]MCB9003734.1 hypothetical protein [Ardenticatenaceae bacterium]